MDSRSQPYKTLKATYVIQEQQHEHPIIVPYSDTIEYNDENEKQFKEKNNEKEIKENFVSPEVWGPRFWFTLHNGAINYPSLANPLCIERMKNFILAIPIMIPCHTCKDHALAYIEIHKDYLDMMCSGRDKLFKFFVDFHNYVNKRLNKPEMSYDDAYRLYDQ
jgi:FAD-linked sulfhydryl oxidase